MGCCVASIRDSDVVWVVEYDFVILIGSAKGIRFFNFVRFGIALSIPISLSTTRLFFTPPSSKPSYIHPLTTYPTRLPHRSSPANPSNSPSSH